MHHHKILIVTTSLEDRETFEKVFSEMLEGGGELIFSEKQEDIDRLVQREHPNLLILDSLVVKKKISFPNNQIIWIRKKGERSEEGEKTLFRPFTADEAISQIGQIIDFFHLEKIRPSPM